MQVELLYFADCPNWTVADERLAQALDALGREDVVVVHRRIETATQAEEVGFTGSPTVRVDGRDPFETGTEAIGLACRVYRTHDGLSGSPSVAEFIEALSRSEGP